MSIEFFDILNILITFFAKKIIPVIVAISIYIYCKTSKKENIDE